MEVAIEAGVDVVAAVIGAGRFRSKLGWERTAGSPSVQIGAGLSRAPSLILACPLRDKSRLP
jgi:hypothetical protein